MRLREDGRLDAAAGTATADDIAAPIDKLLTKLQETFEGNAGSETAQICPASPLRASRRCRPNRRPRTCKQEPCHGP